MSSMKLFNFKYAKQNTRKSIGFLAVMFIIIPILSLVTLYNYANSNSNDPFQIKEIIMPNLMGMFILPFLLSNVLLGYVYSQKQIDFTNSMPISRKKIFFTNIIIGIIYLVLMQLVSLLFSSIYLTVSNTYLVTFEMLFDMFLVLTIGYIFVYTVSMLALAISGNTFMQFVIIALILFLIPFIRVSFLNAFNIQKNINFINADGSQYTYQEIPEQYFETYTIPVNTAQEVKYSETIYNTKSMAITTILSLVYIIIGSKIFENKKMESAGYSFNSAKAHLFVKILTLYPIVVIFYSLHKELLLVQNILIVILIFAYYYVFDLITNKKIKFKITIATFVISFMILFGAKYLTNYVEDYLLAQNEQVNYNDIEQVFIKDYFKRDMSYELVNKDDWADIFDNLLQDPDKLFADESEIYTEEYQEYIYNSCYLSLSLKLANGKTKGINVCIPRDIHVKILEKMKNDDQYIEDICKSYRLNKEAVIVQLDYYKAIPLKDDSELRNAINDHLSKEYMKNIIQTVINWEVNRDENIEEPYVAGKDYILFVYKDHKLQQYSLQVKDGEKVNDELIKVYNEISKQRIEEAFNNTVKPTYPQIIRTIRRLENKGYQNTEIEFNLYADKDIIEFIKEDYTNDFDSEKPYYRINDEWTGSLYYTNNVERIESILEKYVNLDEAFSVTY